jgi:hypothetical protein
MREKLDGLLKNYRLAIKLVNAETMKGRLVHGEALLDWWEHRHHQLLMILGADVQVGTSAPVKTCNAVTPADGRDRKLNSNLKVE